MSIFKLMPQKGVCFKKSLKLKLMDYFSCFKKKKKKPENQGGRNYRQPLWRSGEQMGKKSFDYSPYGSRVICKSINVLTILSLSVRKMCA